MTRDVPSCGPRDARMLFVGEAPGAQEVARGYPFANIGGAGGYVRATLKRHGVEPDDVRWANVIPYNPGRLTLPIRRRLVAAHWANIDADLDLMPRVIVACGGAALMRLTGRSDITDEHGGVWPTSELPGNVNLGGVWRQTRLPVDALVVACLHPAGVMMTKIQAERVLTDAAIARACEYANGRVWRPSMPLVVEAPTETRLDGVLSRSNVVTLDTEFNPSTGMPFLVGVLGDHEPDTVFIWNPAEMLRYGGLNAVLQIHLNRSAITRVAHYAPADRAALLAVSINPGREWYDTLYAYALLYPDLNVGLNHAALHICDDASNWKAMSTSDPTYLALDVHRTYRVQRGIVEMIQRVGMIQVWAEEAAPTGVMMDDLERGGIRVDSAKQSALLMANTRTQTDLARAIAARVGGRFKGAQIKRKCVEIVALLPDGWPSEPCVKHPSYNGVRAKRWTADCSCRALYDTLPVVRAYDRPFAPGNNHDLQWLLYEGLRLPVQRHPNTGAPTADSDAVNRICVRLTEAQGNPRSKYHRDDWQEIVALLADVKEYQHLDKMRSTFLVPPVDDRGFAHPQHRGWGTGTGRPAGGFDGDLATEGALSKYTFNAFNIPRAPERCRELFVPSLDSWRFVYADWSSLESWLTAHFARDPVLRGELEAALRGAPKPHALNAAMIYGCDPLDAKLHKIVLKGRPATAYDGGKRISHLWNYGGEAGKISQTFWLDRAFAIEVERKLAAKYTAISAWRTALADDVFGVPAWRCSRCRTPRTGEQPRGAVCSCGAPLRRNGWAQDAARELRTPFGRRRMYLGRRTDGRKAVAAQLPQSSGASMWYRTLRRLHAGQDGDAPWPVPSFPYRVVTGTYDSFLLECPRDHTLECLTWLLWTMEQPWRQLGMLRIPAEGYVGNNYGEASNDNPQGLMPCGPKTFGAKWPIA